MFAVPDTIERRPPASGKDLAELRAELGKDLPEPLVELLTEADGLQGWLEPSGAYLSLYTAEEILLINRMFRMNVSGADSLLVFASDGGRKLAAFDLKVHPATVLGLPFELKRTEVLFRCATLEALMDRLQRSGWEAELALSNL
ncbi:MAG TPA: SMI1/KNR4 family protein [Myxococcaceae bacterium]|nr:SMI1/KNR4 family protein [Myxococcaceae bacterium]